MSVDVNYLNCQKRTWPLEFEFEHYLKKKNSLIAHVERCLLFEGISDI